MFQFAFPWILLLLPLPWFVSRYASNAQKSSVNGLKVPFFNELQKMTTGEKFSLLKKQAWRHYLLWLIWILLVLSASNPQWLGDPISVTQKGRDIMLAVDISGSMEIPDMSLNGQALDRLSALKAIASQFIDERKGDRLGLILFGTHAYSQAPLTFDRQAIKNLLNDASIALAGPQTAMGDAIGLAIKRLKSSRNPQRVLILLTDGANNSGELSPLDAAELAAKEKIKIYTIGIGNDRLVVNHIFGPQAINPSTDLDENTLQTIAEKTQGRYFRAKDTDDLKNIYEELNQLEPINSDAIVFRPVTWLFQWPLGLAFILSLYLALRKIHFSILNRSGLEMPS